MNYAQKITGDCASRGVVEGKVKIVKSYKESFDISLEKGEIIVAKKTYPELIIFMEKASAIVTETGGILSHAAIVSRELGIPCVVNVIDATKILKDGMKVKVDGTEGIVYLEIANNFKNNYDKIEQKILKEHKHPKNPGLSYIYKEIDEELNELIDSYKDINFKVSENQEDLINKLSSFMHQKIIEKAIPLMKNKYNTSEFNDWMNTLQKALDFYENAKTSSKKMIAITWMDKIIRATS